MQIKDFTDLHCWQACRAIVDWTFRITRSFPKSEYRLISNMNEAARSSTRNIAEGYGRHHHKENTQFCRMSRGSLYELHDDLITALNAGYLDDQEASLGRELINRAIQVVNGYIRYLRSLS